MKRMNSKFFAVLLVCVLAALWAAPAWARPKWVSIKSKVSIVRNEKQKDQNANDYKKIRVAVTYTNNSKDKIITAIFNKTLSQYADIYVKEKQADITAYSVNVVYRDVDRKIGSYDAKGLKYTSVNKCELYPGQSMTLNYDFTLVKTMPTWDAGNRKKFNTGKPFVKNLKWSHDFQVRTEDL